MQCQSPMRFSLTACFSRFQYGRRNHVNVVLLVNLLQLIVFPCLICPGEVGFKQAFKSKSKAKHHQQQPRVWHLCCERQELVQCGRRPKGGRLSGAG